MTTTTTWAEEDAGRLVRGSNPDGFCTDPCEGVGVLHRHLTATSPHRTVQVTVMSGRVYATNGAFMGDVEGMERLGWEFA